jgi:hypothetical protein
MSLQDHELAGRERAIVARERESAPILRLLFPSPHLLPILSILFIWNESLLCHLLQMKSREKALEREREREREREKERFNLNKIHGGCCMRRLEVLLENQPVFGP